METTIYLFLNSKNEIIYVGKTENFVQQRIACHHKGKMVFYETSQIIFSKWSYNAEDLFIKLFKPKHNRDVKFTNKKFDKSFIEDLTLSEWFKFPDKSNKIFRIDGINFEYYILFRLMSKIHKCDMNFTYETLVNIALSNLFIEENEAGWEGQKSILVKHLNQQSSKLI
ncbi:hypothetical protein MTsPCn5_17050 [Croceitalea sp. MTPC5]|uniref:GIY-YIG nuclease family protein n=1 Tax=Croceitalea marina TaxID=1775166 RepID=A0ABW5MVD3_9FLAO|nr:hypothetical protein MTsPCn5_17050 [Croceitalea sp. MTPC5]